MAELEGTLQKNKKICMGSFCDELVKWLVTWAVELRG